jgi:ABC-type multidrug transport system ATPase subunit
MDNYIDIRNLGLSRNGKDIIRNVNLGIQNGKVLAVLGPNGAGKSSLLEMILNDFKPTRGEIVYSRNKKDVLKSRLGVVYNNQFVFPQLHVREVLSFYKGMYQSDGAYLSELIRLFDLEKLSDRPVKELSEGEKKKLAIALALFHHPEFLVMDEPFANIDTTIIDDIWLEIRKLNATTVIATHDWDFAQKYADEMVFLENGSMLCEKFSPDEIGQVTGASKKLVVTKMPGLAEKLAGFPHYEKDELMHVFLTPEVSLQAIRKITLNYSILEISVRDIYYYLSSKKNN